MYPYKIFATEVNIMMPMPMLRCDFLHFVYTCQDGISAAIMDQKQLDYENSGNESKRRKAIKQGNNLKYN